MPVFGPQVFHHNTSGGKTERSGCGAGRQCERAGACARGHAGGEGYRAFGEVRFDPGALGFADPGVSAGSVEGAAIEYLNLFTIERAGGAHLVAELAHVPFELADAIGDGLGEDVLGGSAGGDEFRGQAGVQFGVVVLEHAEDGEQPVVVAGREGCAPFGRDGIEMAWATRAVAFEADVDETQFGKDVQVGADSAFREVELRGEVLGAPLILLDEGGEDFGVCF